MTINKFLLFFALSHALTLCISCAQPSSDIPVSAEIVAPNPQANISSYPWINPQLNMVQFYDREAMTQFFYAWGNAAKERLSVVLLGDSHLQTGPYPEQMARRFHSDCGHGGLGLIFPNSTVKMYSPTLYKSTHTGKWSRQRAVTRKPKKDLGLRGFTSAVEELPASFTCNFGIKVPDFNDIIKIYCKNTPASYDLMISFADQKITVPIDGSNGLPYVEIQIPEVSYSKLTFEVVKRNEGESEFELYGISLENSKETGAIVHNAGVGAAQYCSILYENRFDIEMPHFNADLVVIDFGTNDYLYSDKILPELDGEIRRVIKKVKAAAPNASIILTTVQDLYWKEKNCKSAVPFAQMIHRIAKDTKCGVYDWFYVAGGPKSLLDWRSEKLARKDMVHLTIKGYKLKADLFFEAIINSAKWLANNPNKNELLLNYKQVKPAPQKPSNSNSTPKTSYSSEQRNADTKVHKIKAGESLSKIAQKYNVSVSQLKEWNALDSDLIYAGHSLIIRK